MSSKDIVQMTLLRPLTMTFTEPIVLAIDLYIGLVYAILYSYFESFPIVYLEGYMFPTANSNLPFLALLVGSIISYIGYCLWNRYVPFFFFLFFITFTSSFSSLRSETRMKLIPDSISKRNSMKPEGKSSPKHDSQCL
jgi:hypothetical protein